MVIDIAILPQAMSRKIVASMMKPFFFSISAAIELGMHQHIGQ